jgi:hypothetical protein
MVEKRWCASCSRNRALKHFVRNGYHPDGSIRIRSQCKDCSRARHASGHQAPHKCTACGVVKPPSDFAGRCPTCRPCHNKRTDEYKRTTGREAHIRRMSKYQSVKYKTDPTFRQKTAARAAVFWAIKLGTIVRPDKCPSCKRKVKVHAHHHNGYEPAHYLDIEWLCPRCHYQEDKDVHSYG